MKKVFYFIFVIQFTNCITQISARVKEYPSSRYLALKKQQQQKENGLQGLFGKRKYLNNIKQGYDNSDLQIQQDNRIIRLDQLQQNKDPLSNVRYVQEKRKLENLQNETQVDDQSQQKTQQQQLEDIKKVYEQKSDGSKLLLSGQKADQKSESNRTNEVEEEDEGFINHQEKDIKTLLTSALQSSKDSSPIIIINQPDESAGNLSAKEQLYIPNQQNYTQIYEQVDLNTVDVLIQIITNLENIYDAYYKNFPSQNFAMQSIDQNYQFKNQMQKLNNFARQVISKSHLIMKDLNFYENRVKLMNKGESNMMKFFFLDTKYKRLKLQTKTINEGFIQQAWRGIDKNVEEYDELVDFVQENSIKLYRFNQYFADNIKAITKTYSLSDTVLDNFDQVMKFSVKLLEIKEELEQVLSDLKVRFVKFHMLKRETASLLFQMDRGVSAAMTDIQITQKKQEEEQKEQLEKESDKNQVKKEETTQNKHTNNLIVIISMFLFIFQII